MAQGQFICPAQEEMRAPAGQRLVGRFGADMQVASVNDGPVTILFDMDR